MSDITTLKKTSKFPFVFFLLVSVIILPKITRDLTSSAIFVPTVGHDVVHQLRNTSAFVFSSLCMQAPTVKPGCQGSWGYLKAVNQRQSL